MAGGKYLLILPAFMHFVQTSTFLTFPLIIVLIFCRFGENVRLLTRDVLLPVPPFFFSCPLRESVFPNILPFAHEKHIFAIFIKVRLMRARFILKLVVNKYIFNLIK